MRCILNLRMSIYFVLDNSYLMPLVGVVVALFWTVVLLTTIFSERESGTLKWKREYD